MGEQFLLPWCILISGSGLMPKELSSLSLVGRTGQELQRVRHSGHDNDVQPSEIQPQGTIVVHGAL
jgi:hypothetical protein